MLALLGLRPAAADDAGILLHRQRQVLQLQRLLTPAEPSRRAELLHRLARLELEVAVLRGAGGGRLDLDAPVFSCRRLLAELPGYARADEVRLFLARLERRRGRTAQALAVLGDLRRHHPRSPVICKARLLEGGCQLDRKDRAAARTALQSVLVRPSCAAAARHEARYQLAWTLLADQRGEAAAVQLRWLCQQGGVERRMAQRAVRDLALAWSMGQVPPDAGRFLLERDRTGGLVLLLGQRLLAEGKLHGLMRLTGPLLGDRRLVGRLRALRVRALAQHGTAAQLERELVCAGGSLSGDLREEVARAILGRARRLEGDGKQQPALQLYRRLAVAYVGGAAAAEARFHLGQLLLGRGELEAAVLELEAASRSRRLEHGLRARAAYRLVYCLEQLGRADRSVLPRLVAAGRRFLQEHPRAAEVPDVMLAVGSRLAATPGREAEAAALLGSFVHHRPAYPGRSVGLDLLLVAQERAGQHRMLYDLARQELARCSDEAVRGRLRRAAARAARNISQQLTAERRWGEAYRWVKRAVQALPVRDAARHGLWVAAASLAARAGKSREGQGMLRELAEREGAPRERRDALVELARHQEAAGELVAAAATYGRLAPGSPTLKLQLRWLESAAEAAALGGDRALAQRRIRELRRRLRRAPTQLIGPWQVRVGQLLELASGERAAYRHYLRQAHALWRHDGRSAARCLLRAAERGPSPGHARRLFEQARVQAGALSRGGKVAVVAVRARLGLARQVRAATRHVGVRRRLEELQVQQGVLMELLRLPAPRWAAAAGLELALLMGEMAAALRASPLPRDLSAQQRGQYRDTVQQRAGELDRMRGRLLLRLARGAGAPAGPDRFTLAAARQLLPATMPALSPVHLPRTGEGPAAVVLRQLRRGTTHARAARRIAGRALEVHGQRADLLCARAVASFALEDVRAGHRDLVAALRVAPDCRCARLNLAVLALWRKDAAEARALLNGVAAPPAAFGAAFGVLEESGRE